MMHRDRIKTWLRISYRLFRVYWQSIWGAWKVSALEDPIVSIFGGSHIQQSDYYAKKAFELARMFSNAGISVLTGGGPGIMQAVSCGVIPDDPIDKKTLETMLQSHLSLDKKRGKTIGIGVTDLDEAPNRCVHEYIELDYFFARKWLLTRYASAVVVFPGGFGTCDELFEVLTLIQTKKSRKIPIILVGIEYWQPLYDWLSNELLQHNLIQPEYIKLFTMTDDLSEVFRLVCAECTSANH